MSDKFDLFVSYKSQDANEVRSVVDSLIANGLRVWFAEYHVLLPNYTQFQTAIDKGIDDSQFALIFCNDSWARSQYCQLEIVRILQNLSLERILLVTIPAGFETQTLMKWVLHKIAQNALPEPGITPYLSIDDVTGKLAIPQEDLPFLKRIDLSAVRAIPWEDEPEKVIRFVVQSTGLLSKQVIPSPILQSHSATSRWTQRRFGVTLNPGVFEEQVNPESEWFTSVWGAGFFKAKMESHTLLMAVLVSPFEPAIASLSAGPTSSDDDRQLYGLYRKYAREFIADHDGIELGLHLFYWGIEKKSQMALTYILSKSDKEQLERRYALTIETADGAVAEINIMFAVNPEQEDRMEAFRTFCKFSPYFEKIVASLTYEPPPRWGEFTVVTLGAKSVAIIATLTGLIVALSYYTVPEICALWAAVNGVLFADAFLFFTWRPVSQVNQLIGSYSMRLNRPQSFLTRLMADLYDQIWGTFIWAPYAVFGGIVDWLGVLPIAAGLFLGIMSPWYWAVTGALVGGLGIVKYVNRCRKRGVPLREATKWAPGTPAMISCEGIVSVQGIDSARLDEPDIHQSRDRPLRSPLIRLDDAHEISPYLPGLLAELRRNDRRFYSNAVWGWSVGMIWAGIQGLSGHFYWGIAIAVLACLLVMSYWVVSMLLGEPPPLRHRMRRCRQEPSPESVRCVVGGYQELGDEGGVVAYLSRAVQWAVVLCQMCPERYGPLVDLGLAASSLSHAMTLRPQFFTHSLAYRAFQVGDDAYALSIEKADKVDSNRDVDRIRRLRATNQRLWEESQRNESQSP